MPNKEIPPKNSICRKTPRFGFLLLARTIFLYYSTLMIKIFLQNSGKYQVSQFCPSLTLSQQQTLDSSKLKSLQTTTLNLMKMTESFLKG